MNSRELSQEELLQHLGADDSSVFEVIVSTFSPGGTPNAAPMGIQFARKSSGIGESRILIKPYKSTTTYHNLSRQREAVINVSSDPRIFFESAFKRQIKGDKLAIRFADSEKVKAPRISNCDAYIEVTVEKVVDLEPSKEERSEVSCRIELVRLQNQVGRLYIRAPHVLIESIIHATRVIELRSKGLGKETDELVELMDRYRKLIHRVAPSSQYVIMAEELMRIAERNG
jgi:hypothetical protein